MKRTLTRLVLSVVTVMILGVTSAHAATFTVDDTGDAGDASAGNGVCATAGAVCTLRAAIEEANALGGADVIEFSIGSGQVTISPATALPLLNSEITIDGTSQPGYSSSPIVKIDGTTAGGSENGIEIDGSGDNVTISGLVITNWGGEGITTQNGITDLSITKNYIGVDFDGSTSAGNSTGVFLFWCVDCTVGGSAANRNVISGNSSRNVEVDRLSTNMEVSGNYIGINAAGTAAVTGDSTGVLWEVDSGTLGGTTADKRNVISGNGGSGVWISGNADGGTIAGNYIGLNAAGDAAVGNVNGIYSTENTGSDSYTIGGATLASRNVISGNTSNAIYLNGTGIFSIQNNYIGPNAAGDDNVANSGSGIRVSGTETITIDSNIISGNSTYGIYKTSSTDGGSITNNYIGPAPSGGSSMGNSSHGIYNTGGSLTIGTNGNGNVISGNSGYGIYLSGTDADGTTIKSNLIGVNATEAGGMYNATYGIGIVSTQNVVIGGTTSGDGNTVGVTTDGAGIYMFGGSGHTIEGNYIGTDRTDQSKDFTASSADYGISLAGSASSITIGGSSSAQNIITGTDLYGVYLGSSSNTGIDISYNLIYGHGTAGIELTGENGNDSDDSDSGANNLLNYPNITTVTYGSNVRVQGSYQGAASTNLTLHVCADSSPPSASAFGQCDQYVGNVGITTDGTGAATFDKTFTGQTVTSGTKMAAYAVDASNNTSEFGSDLNTIMPSNATVPASTYTITSDSELTITNASLSSSTDYGVILQPDNAPYFYESQDLNYYVNSGGTLTACADNNCTGIDTFNDTDFPLSVTGLSNLASNNPSYYLQIIEYSSLSNYGVAHSPLVEIRPLYWELFDASYTTIKSSYENSSTIYFEYENFALANDDTTGGTTSATLATDAGDTETITLTEVGDTGVYRGSIATSQTASPTSSNSTLEGTAGGTTTATLSVNITTDLVTFLDDFESYLDLTALQVFWTLAGSGTTNTLETALTNYYRVSTSTAGVVSMYSTAANLFGSSSFDGTGYTLNIDVKVNDKTLLGTTGFDFGSTIFNDFEYVGILLQDGAAVTVRKDFPDTYFTDDTYTTISAEFDCTDDFESGSFGNCGTFDFTDISAIELAAYTDTGGDAFTMDIENIILQKSTNTVDSSTNFTATSTQQAGINVSSFAVGTVAEGAADTFTVVLLTDPGVNVTVTTTTDAQSSASPSVLTFTSGNYSTPQTITVTAVDDSDDEADTHTSTLSFVVSAASGNYSSATMSDMTLNITDNDSSEEEPAIGGGGGGGGGDSSNNTDTDNNDSAEENTEESTDEESQNDDSEKESTDEDADEKDSEEETDNNSEEESENKDPVEVPAEAEEDDEDKSEDTEEEDSDKEDSTNDDDETESKDEESEGKNEDEYEEKSIDGVDVETKSSEEKLDKFFDVLTDNDSEIADEDGYVAPDESNNKVVFTDEEEEKEYKCELKYDVASFKADLDSIESAFKSVRSSLIKERRAKVKEIRERHDAVVRAIKNNGGDRDQIRAERLALRSEIESLENDYENKILELRDEMQVKVDTIESDIDILNSQIDQLEGRCERVNLDTNIDFNVDSDKDGLPDFIEEKLGIDEGGETEDDYDGDGIDDVSEVFLTFTDVKNADDVDFTAGVTGQTSAGGVKQVKSNGKVVITGKISEDNNVDCVIEKSTSATRAVSSFDCNEKVVRADNDIYMLEVDPGDGEHTIRVQDARGNVARFETVVDSGFEIDSPTLYDFDGFRSDDFDYIDDNTIVVNKDVRNSLPVTVADPTGCVAFGQCIVQARWNSLIFSSVILADSSAGRAVITPPKELEPGEHRLLLTTVDTETNEISDTLEVNFVIDENADNTLEEVKDTLFSINKDQWLIIGGIFALTLMSMGYLRRQKVAQKALRGK